MGIKTQITGVIFSLVGFACSCWVLCTIRYIQPTRVETVSVYLASKDLSTFDNPTNLKNLYDRMMVGEEVAYRAYFANRQQLIAGWVLEHNIKELEEIKQFIREGEVQIGKPTTLPLDAYSHPIKNFDCSAGPDSFILHLVLWSNKIDTLIFVPNGSVWTKRIK